MDRLADTTMRFFAAFFTWSLFHLRFLMDREYVDEVGFP